MTTSHRRCLLCVYDEDGNAMQLKRWLLAMLFILAIAIPAAGKEQKKKLVLLKPETCTVDHTILDLLPDRWRQYAEFTKVCQLKGDDGEPTVAIVSIWVFDFYNAKYTAGSPTKWEDFPLPLIIDSRRTIVGELPEHYPDDPPRELEIYYSKGMSAAPPSIKVQVYNPAVDGNYSYSLIKWNDGLGRYEMKDKTVNYAR